MKSERSTERKLVFQGGPCGPWGPFERGSSIWPRSMVDGEMGAAAGLKVPLMVDTGVGQNWDEAH
jgi:hypothetical protein